MTNCVDIGRLCVPIPSFGCTSTLLNHKVSSKIPTIFKVFLSSHPCQSVWQSEVRDHSVLLHFYNTELSVYLVVTIFTQHGAK